MGTKRNPGEYDCYGKAEPDEPLFTLLGRDASSSYMVEIWRHVQAGDFETARLFLKGCELILTAAPGKFLGKKDPKFLEAGKCATEMALWRTKLAVAKLRKGL